ncbi:MAG TPA: exopolysaccharide biosynthesis protein, partial [Lachnospiraceae bacterium]|nr:exopolysaccharide biosynthesis protein [Lachnospiraceae bacterium]
QIKELPFIYMEKIDWFKKGTSFLKAKFLHQKYESSF